MALIQCQRCGKMFSDLAGQCPGCGCTKEENKQLALEYQRKAEEARLAEEARIAEEKRKSEADAAERASKRKQWWQKNKIKVIICVLIPIALIVASVCVFNRVSSIKKDKAISVAMRAIASGDSCLKVNNFDEAEKYYYLASKSTDDAKIQYFCADKIKALDQVRTKHQNAENKRDYNIVSSNRIAPTNAELWEDFETAYLNYYQITSLTQSRYSVARKNIQNFLYAGKQEGADISRILTDYSSDWKWLGDYIQQVNGSQITSEVRWRFSVVAFFLANEGDTRYNVDFTYAGEPEAWESAYQAAH